MDSDCRISKEEFEYLHDHQHRFSSFDLNGDGMLNYEEFEFKSCSAFKTADNCENCGTNGWCEECAEGFRWLADIGCVASSSGTGTGTGTGQGTGTGKSTGEVCSLDGTCADGGMCLSRCCSAFMTANNCEVCGTDGWCEQCAEGFEWLDDIGWVAFTLGTGIGTGTV